MAINFPNTPSNGQTHVVNNITYTWDGLRWLASISMGATGSTGATGPAGNITVETLQVLDSSSGIVVHNYNLGGLYLHTNVAANFTANFTNVPTANNNVINFTLIIYQPATARLPNAVQIDGVAQTINWIDNQVPVPVSNKKEIYSFSLIRASSAWTVLGAFSTYG